MMTYNQVRLFGFFNLTCANFAQVQIIAKSINTNFLIALLQIQRAMDFKSRKEV